MRKVMIIIAVAIIGLMSACAGNKTWVKDGMTPEQYNRDNMDCKKIAASGGSGNPLIMKSMYMDCMKGLGYEVEYLD